MTSGNLDVIVDGSTLIDIDRVQQLRLAFGVGNEGERSRRAIPVEAGGHRRFVRLRFEEAVLENGTR